MLKHRELTNLLAKLGYTVNKGGMCFGVSAMATQAILVDDLKTYIKRIKLLSTINENELAQKIADAQDKELKLVRLKKEIKVNDIKDSEEKLASELKQVVDGLDADHSLLLSIRTFFDGIVLHFAPQLYPNVFDEKERPDSQDIERTFIHILPAQLIKKVEDEKNNLYVEYTSLVEKVAVFSGIFNRLELQESFQLLEDMLAKLNLKTPISFMLNSTSHGITVGWHPQTKKWSFVDANQLDLILKTHDAKAIANNVLAGFSKNSITTFDAEIFTTTDQAKQVKAAFKELQQTKKWQALYMVTESKAQQKDSEDRLWLHVAANTGDFERVKQLVEKKSNIHSVDKKGRSVLMRAMNCKRLDIMQFLLDNKANPNLLDQNEFSCIFSAIHCGLIDCVSLLLKYRADPNLRTKDGETPLQMACNKNDIELVKLLLSYKANPHLSDKDGETPLYIACRKKNIALVQLLLNQKVDPNKIVQPKNLTAFYMAVESGAKDIVELLIAAKAKIDVPIETAPKILMYLAGARKDEVQKLLKVKRQDTVEKIHGFTPLHAAAFLGHTEIVKILLAQEMKVNVVTTGNISAIEFAEAMGHKEIVNILIHHQLSQLYTQSSRLVGRIWSTAKNDPVHTSFPVNRSISP